MNNKIKSIIKRYEDENIEKGDEKYILYQNIITYLKESENSREIYNDMIKKLINDIKKEKPYFENRIRISTFVEPIFLRPYWNNRRIEKQEGYFILFGMDGNKKKQPKIKAEDYDSYIIPNTKKGKILDELNTLGINEKSLFPEMGALANHLKAKYSL